MKGKAHPSGWYSAKAESGYTKESKAHFFDNDERASVCGMLQFQRKMKRTRDPVMVDTCKLCLRMVLAYEAAP